jgi:hypothetical protein
VMGSNAPAGPAGGVDTPVSKKVVGKIVKF